MKIYPNQLSAQLHKNLATIYLVSGDEHLLVQESRDAIVKQAKEKGFATESPIQVEKSFSWDEFLLESRAQSLFSNQTILELRLQTSKIGKPGGNAILEYLQSPPPDKLLLIISPKIDSSTTKTKWYTAIEKSGVIVTAWPIERNQLPAWIKERMAQVGLSTDAQGLNLIADFTEGNLLATAQEIEKLRLIHGSGKISAQDIENCIGDSSRFDIFQLVDTALSGNTKKSLHVLERLKEEGAEPILVLWALTREIRTLINIHFGLKEGKPIDLLFKQNGIWNKKQPIIRHAVNKLSLQHLYKLLQNAEKIDRTIKGLEVGNYWDDLASSLLNLSGSPLSPV